MSVRSDALTIIDLCHRIVAAEDLKQQFIDQGGIVYINSDPNFPLTPTNAQKQATLAAESSWQTSVKTISAAW